MRQFGQLKEINFTGRYTTRKSPIIRCLCSCGKFVEYSENRLVSGNTKSCGCRIKTPEYKTWLGMIQRCTNPKAHAFFDYGGRNIKIFPEWYNFDKFIQFVGRRPIGKTLDRIDTNGDYVPGNVKWSTDKEQMRNRRNNCLTMDDIPKIKNMMGKTQKEIAKEMGVDQSTINRVLSGKKWS